MCTYYTIELELFFVYETNAQTFKLKIINISVLVIVILMKLQQYVIWMSDSICRFLLFQNDPYCLYYS